VKRAISRREDANGEQPEEEPGIVEGAPGRDRRVGEMA
jgi:hypothetical protein